MATRTHPYAAPPAATRANIIDRLVGYLNPRAGLQRAMAREQLVRAYEGASRRDGWRPRRAGASANADHKADAAELRVRARALVQNVPYITRAIEALATNAIGTGITPRSLAKGSAAKRTDTLIADWAKVADADGAGDLYSLQARAYRAMNIDGEVLVRMRHRRVEDGLPIPLQLQLLEIDWLDTGKIGRSGGNTVVNGIEYDALGRIVGYWLFDQHPGELAQTLRSGAMRVGTSSLVPARNIIHLFRPERPGQGRGFSRLAPVISRVRDVQLYEDAELQRKNLETRMSVLASGDVNTLEGPGSSGAPGDLGQLASGGITGLPPGMNITVLEPKAAPGYVDYIKQQLHIIAAGVGVTYEMLSGDMKEVNFSSARVALGEFRRTIEQEQWLLLIPVLCDRIWREAIDMAVLAGALPRADYAVDWSTPRWDYVNPLQDVNADVAEIHGGLCSISEKLRRRGYKPDLVFAELQSDLQRLQADGTLGLLAAMKSGNAQAIDADMEANGTGTQPKSADD